MIRGLLLSLLAGSLFAQDLFLDNGSIRIGVDPSRGGSIIWLSTSSADGPGPNMINSADLGRQIQQSYYAGPQPYGVAHPSWKNWPWNPIGSGDVYGNRSKALNISNDGKTLYVETLPMQWALNNVPCECTFETWVELEGNVARVRSRLNNKRTDADVGGDRDQELPALYTNGIWHRLFTVSGEITEIRNAGPPWASWHASESWAALVDDNEHGVGIWHPGVHRFIGGFHGKRGSGGPSDSATGYIAPLHRDILDNNIRYEYEYRLIVGSLQEIRKYVNERAKTSPPSWTFGADRQHWTSRNAASQTWPLTDGVWRVDTSVTDDPQLISPPLNLNAEDAPRLYIRAAFTGEGQGEVFFRPLGAAGFDGRLRAGVGVINDGQMRTYTVQLAEHPSWDDTIVQLRFDPPAKGTAEIRYIGFAAPQ